MMGDADANGSGRAAGPLTRALMAEFGESFRMFADVVSRLSDEAWGEGGPTWTEVPARAAMHTLMCARHYIAGEGESTDWEPGGVQFWASPIDALPDRRSALAEVAAASSATRAYLETNGDEGLLRERAGSNPSRTRVHQMVYALRHLQHHVAQMSSESKRRGLGAASWGD